MGFFDGHKPGEYKERCEELTAENERLRSVMTPEMHEAEEAPDADQFRTSEALRERGISTPPKA